MFSIILYSHRDFKHPLHRFCLDTLICNAMKAPVTPEIIIISGEKIDNLPKNVINSAMAKTPGQSSHLDISRRIISGLMYAKHENCFICEHDVLYPEGYFSRVHKNPKNAFYYNRNLYVLNEKGFFPSPRMVTSNVYANKKTLKKLYLDRIAHISGGGRIVWSEPGKNPEDPIKNALFYDSKNPVIDTRLAMNFTGPRNAKNESDYKQSIEYWPYWKRLLLLLTFGGCPECYQPEKKCICKEKQERKKDK